MSATSNLHIAWAELLLRSLVSSGVSYAVISPGSRSTPLVLAAAAERPLRCEVAIDERTAAFMALGHGRVTGRPALLICTSGTAAAHYLPAIIEASQSNVPMVVLTADRPWDAYDCAAPQTVDQLRLYGVHVRHYAELGLPDADALRAVVRVAAQSCARSMGPIAGPVHINARFRKPLEPVDAPENEPWRAEHAALMRAGSPRVEPTRFALHEESVMRVVLAENVLFALGPKIGSASVEPVLSLAASLNAPVLAEATSGARFVDEKGATVLRAIDAVLSAKAFCAAHEPSLVVEIGAPMVSSVYAKWVTERERERVVVAPSGYNDPSSSASQMITADAATFARACAEAIASERENEAQEMARNPRLASRFELRDAARVRLRKDWQRADAIARDVAAKTAASATLTEASIAATLRATLPENAHVMLGNSTIVRDVDCYAFEPSPSLRVHHQRGASGIDGLVAGAMGARAAVRHAPVVLWLGDVSLWHDVGSLQQAAEVREPLVIVVVQNGGGRIFDRLPISKNEGLRSTYERFMLTPRGRSFEGVSRAFGLQYTRVDAVDAFREALHRAVRTEGATVIEAVVDGDGAARYAALVRESAAMVDAMTAGSSQR